MKRALDIITLMILLAVATGITWGIYRTTRSSLKKAPDVTADSIFHYRQLERQHADSAAYYSSLASQTYEKYINSQLRDAHELDSVRTIYRERLRATIREGLTRQSDSLRAAEAGHL